MAIFERTTSVQEHHLVSKWNTTVLLGKYYSPYKLNDYVTNNFAGFLSQVNSELQASYNLRSRDLSK